MTLPNSSDQDGLVHEKSGVRSDTKPTKRIHSTYVAHYMRYGRHDTEECDTLEEAKSFLKDGEDYGQLSTELIELPDGSYIEGDELSPIFGKREPGCRLKVDEVRT